MIRARAQGLGGMVCLKERRTATGASPQNRYHQSYSCDMCVQGAAACACNHPRVSFSALSQRARHFRVSGVWPHYSYVVQHDRRAHYMLCVDC